MIRLLLTSDDVDIFRRIRLEALREEPNAFASTAAQWEALSEEEWKDRMTHNPVFVAFNGPEPVGLMGYMRQGADKMAHRATLVMVYLRKDRRCGGFAGAMLAALMTHARETGIRQMELAVSTENPAAVRFYEREGFVPFGRIPCGFLQDGREVDEILMAKRTEA